MKSIITLSFILYFGPNIFSSSIDSISVNVIGDTIFFNNYGVPANCFSEFTIRNLFNPWSDTLCLVEIDMMESPADCNCNFDLSQKIVRSLLHQQYVLKVFRYMPFYDITKAYLVGTVTFTYTGGEDLTRLSSIHQSECYTPNNVDLIKEIPIKSNLEQNYPNPFNPSTTIKYFVSEGDNVEIKLYDILGKEVSTLVNEYKTQGEYQIEINNFVKDKHLGSGVYFYQLKAGDYLQTKKMIYLK
jgi:hypothetical protein